ncbi:MAG: hypothetical protein AAFQ62_16910, partial [Pseudomonadota bacterium]
HLAVSDPSGNAKWVSSALKTGEFDRWDWATTQTKFLERFTYTKDWLSVCDSFANMSQTKGETLRALMDRAGDHSAEFVDYLKDNIRRQKIDDATLAQITQDLAAACIKAFFVGGLPHSLRKQLRRDQHKITDLASLLKTAEVAADATDGKGGGGSAQVSAASGDAPVDAAKATGKGKGKRAGARPGLSAFLEAWNRPCDRPKHIKSVRNLPQG